jgi:hypothetical protein
MEFEVGDEVVYKEGVNVLHGTIKNIFPKCQTGITV